MTHNELDNIHYIQADSQIAHTKKSLGLAETDPQGTIIELSGGTK